MLLYFKCVFVPLIICSTVLCFMAPLFYYCLACVFSLSVVTLLNISTFSSLTASTFIFIPFRLSGSAITLVFYFCCYTFHFNRTSLKYVVDLPHYLPEPPSVNLQLVMPFLCIWYIIFSFLSRNMVNSTVLMFLNLHYFRCFGSLFMAWVNYISMPNSLINSHILFRLTLSENWTCLLFSSITFWLLQFSVWKCDLVCFFFFWIYFVTFLA